MTKKVFLPAAYLGRDRIMMYVIVEFFNSHHPDPNDPEAAEQIDEQFPDGMFRFEKHMA